ncbi:MAG: RuBisCO large subunit C-terminal-like domain-containing protein [Acidimicrobiales bacterium]
MSTPLDQLPTTPGPVPLPGIAVTSATPIERVRAVYEVIAAPGDIDAVARALATEQSVEMPLSAITDHRVLDEVVATVEAVEPIHPADDHRDHRDHDDHGDRPGQVIELDQRFRITLGLAAETVCDHHGQPDVAQLWNMLFGNCSLMEGVRLLDVTLPDAMLQYFGGPRFGVAGLRERCGVPQRALTCAALKPQGMAPQALAALGGRLAMGGLDLIKDDHGLSDQPAAPFAQRVPAVQAAVTAANAATGGTTRYAPSLVGSPTALVQQARLARKVGVEVVLIAPALVGMAAFSELVRTELDGMAVLAHPAYAGAARVDPPLLLGRMFRLFGADATIFPNVGGRFSYSASRCAALVDGARSPWGGLAPCLPVPAGGMTADRVPEMLDTYGHDVMLLIGGALLAAGDGLEAEARRFVNAVAGHR